MGLVDRVVNAWNAFRQQAENPPLDYNYFGGGGVTYGGNPPSLRPRRFQNERTIITSIYTRISIDVAAVIFRHVKYDDQDRFKENVKSTLNQCLMFEPNLDQGPRAFRQDIVQTFFDGGSAAIVPVDTSIDPNTKEVFDIFTLRVGTIVGWYPQHVRVSLYNEKTMMRQEIILEKRFVAIVENPFYNVMNEPNSTLQRLVAKLNLLDAVDEQSGSGKLDLIIQLPYTIRSEARKLQAEQRREDIEFQLKGSKYGIAYTDGTEKITQLNRPIENNLLGQIQYLTDLLYSQLGITAAVMDGTADEKTMINYRNRTILPIVESIKEAMQRSFLQVKTQTDNERIAYFMNPFALTPLSEMADVADKFSRNEIISPNEIRGYMGMPPSDDPKADKLMNSNMPQPPPGPSWDDVDKMMNDTFTGLSSDVDNIVGTGAASGAPPSG